MSVIGLQTLSLVSYTEFHHNIYSNQLKIEHYFLSELLKTIMRIETQNVLRVMYL